MLYQIFNTVLGMSLAAGIAVICVLIVRMFLVKMPKAFSYFLWFVVLFRLLCPVSFTSEYSILGIFNLYQQKTLDIKGDIAGNTAIYGDTPIPVIGDGTNVANNTGDADKTDLKDTGTDIVMPEYDAKDRSIEVYAARLPAFIWIIGVLAMALSNAVSYRKFKKKIGAAVNVYDNVYLSDYIASPFAVGLVKPRIYIPSSVNGTNRDYILLHEKYHIKRLDYIAKPLFFAALCIHWFNPLVWLAFGLFVNDMEMSCDETVVKYFDAQERSEYSNLLLNLSIGKNVSERVPLSFGEGDIKMRIKNIMKPKKTRMAAIVLTALVCSVFASCMSANPKISEPSSNAQDSVSASGSADGTQVTDKDSNRIHIAEQTDYDAYIIDTLEKWADAYIAKDRKMLLSMAYGEAYTMIEKMIMPAKPWPEVNDERAYDIIYADRGRACILYYAQHSSHITVIRELLEYAKQEQEYKIVKENTQFLDAIDNIDDFNNAYSYLNNKNPDGSYSFAGTRLDYEAYGLQNAFILSSTYRYHTPVDAAKYVLNLSNDNSVVNVEESKDANVTVKNGKEYTTVDVMVKFKDGSGEQSVSNQVLVTMKKLDAGIWLPESYQIGINTQVQ